jgi:3D (Asp-Asp-Asp) domain-containing protein
MAISKLVLVVLFVLTLLSLGSAARNIQYRVAYSAETVATAYNSLEGQTDSSPWVTASGTRCRDGVIAANFLPIGTKVKIEGFGNKVFVVEDRMHPRFNHRIDIWFASHKDALKFGKRKIKYHVLQKVG